MSGLKRKGCPDNAGIDVRIAPVYAEMSPRDLYRHLAELGIMPFDHDKNYKLRSKLYQRYQFVDAPMIYAYVRNLLDWNDVSF